MATIERVVSGVANGLAVIGLSTLLVLATFTLLDGVLRAFANYPLDFVREVGDLIAAICGSACLPIALLRESNIVLKSLGKVLPAAGARILNVFAALLIEAVMIGMAWQFYLLGIKTMRAGEVTWLLNLPKAPFWFVVDGILWIAAAVQAFVLICEILGMGREVHSEIAA
jgi:TRAP-type C4-dicarboxylate transport system permease small subunit